MTSLVSSPWSDSRQFNVEAEGVYTERFKLLASDGKSGHEFGCSVAISKDGNTVAVGSANDDDTNGANGGAVYIFTYDGTYWTQQAKILPSVSVAQEKFGCSIALSGDGNTLLVGAVNGSPVTPGSSYVFTRTSSNWSQQAKLNLSNGGYGSSLGQSVSISEDGNVALIAGNETGSNTGEAFVFTRTGVAWAQQSKLVGSDTVGDDSFGTSVSISGTGDVAVVGSPYNTLSGSVYVFARSGAVWTQQAKIKANDGASGDKFGISVSISADGAVLLIGSEVPVGRSVKAVYIFTFSGSTWSQSSKISGAYSERFGSVVAISGDASISMIGCTLDTSTLDWKGSAYAFSRAGSTWTQSSKLIPSDGFTYNRFAESLAISSDSRVVVVGARGDDDKGSRSGSAYIFTRTIADTSFENGSSLISPELEKVAAGYGQNVAMDGDGLEILVAHLYSDRYSDGTSGPVDRGNVRQHTRTDGTISGPLALKEGIPITYTIPSGGSITLNGSGYQTTLTSSGDMIVPEPKYLSVSGKGDYGVAPKTFYVHEFLGYVLDSDPSVTLNHRNGSNYWLNGSSYGITTFVNFDQLTSWPNFGAGQAGTVTLTGPGITSRTATFSSNFLGRAAALSGSTAYWLGTVKKDDGTTVNVRVQFENAYSSTYLSGGSNGGYSSLKFPRQEFVFLGGSSSSPTPSITSYSSILGGIEQALFGRSISVDKSKTDSVVRAYVAMNNRHALLTSGFHKGSVFVYNLPSTTPTAVILSPQSTTEDKGSFGYKLSVPQDSDLLAISDIDVTVNGSLKAGCVYVYKRTGTAWTLERMITREVGALENDLYGSDLSFQKDPVTGNYILAIKSKNRVEIYSRTESSGTAIWVLSQTITPQSGESFDGAIALAKGCSRLIISSGTKKAFIYDRNGSTYTYTRSSTILEIRHPNKDTTATSGRNVAISEAGTVIAIPSYDETTKGQIDIFKLVNGTWTFIKTLTPPSADYNSNGSAYGWSLAMSDDGKKLLIGLKDDTMTTPSFVNYVY